MSLDRPKNIYEELGIRKNATNAEVNQACTRILEAIELKEAAKKNISLGIYDDSDEWTYD